MSSIKGSGTLSPCAKASDEALKDAARSYRANLSGVYLAARLCALAVLLSTTPLAAQPLRIIAFGDSLSAGFDLSAADAFPAQLERRLRADHFEVSVVNASVSGDTTSGGLERLDFALGDGADLVILELGANDMLRGRPPREASQNLEKMTSEIKARGASVLLAGMRAVENFGDDYKRQFDQIYPDLAKREDVALYPFFLEGVAADPKLTLADGLHPNPSGVARIVAGIAPLVEESLTRIKLKRRSGRAGD